MRLLATGDRDARLALEGKGRRLGILHIVGCFAVFILTPERSIAQNAPFTAMRQSISGETFIRLANADAGGHGESKKEEKETGEPPLPPEAEAPQLTPAEQYCSNALEAAASARIALQKGELEKVQAKLDERIRKLEEVTAEAKTWLKKREEFLAKANDGLTEIYAKMSPEAAAGRLLVMNEMIAVAILSKLPPKTASSIIAEIDTAKAARLSSLLAGVADVGAQQKPKNKEAP